MLDKPARSTTRDDLRSAVHKRSGAAKAVSQAEKALSAATTTLKQAQQRLAKYHGIDALLNEHRDAISKAWATGGSNTREYVPPDVIEKVGERDAAADEVAAAQPGGGFDT